MYLSFYSIFITLNSKINISKIFVLLNTPYHKTTIPETLQYPFYFKIWATDFLKQMP